MRRVALRYAPPEVMVLLRRFEARNGAFPQKNVQVESSVPAESVLVLSPHPDDEAIGLGGVLSKHLAQGDECTVLYMTNGRGLGSTNDDLPNIRKKEAESVAREFGFEQIFWDVEDMALTNDDKTVSSLRKILDKLKPSSVYLPSFFDHHFDHFAANQILVDALGKSSHGDITVYGYEVWDNMPFPNLIVDISRNFEQKAAMLRLYVEPMQATDFIELCRCRNALHYTLNIDSRILKSRGYAEAFYRFDAKSYCAAFMAAMQAMQDSRSMLPAHVRQELLS